MLSPLTDAPLLARSLDVERAVLKRDDLLDFGGGNKARRLSALLARVDGPIRRVFAMSNRGAHTFYTLAAMIPTLARGALLFTFEREVGGGRYRDELEASYAGLPWVRRRIGHALPLWFELQAHRLRKRPGDLFLGLGGRESGGDNAYASAVLEDRDRLAGLGPATHLAAAASGDMATGIAAGLQAAALPGEVTAVLTAERWASLGLRLRHSGRRRLQVIPSPLGGAPATSDPQRLEIVSRFAAETGVVVDPHHMAHVVAAAYARRGRLGPTVVIWLSCPRQPVGSP